MSVNKKRLQAYLYSFVGIVAMAVILIIVNLLFRSSNIRFDGTADKLYTLSEGTIKTLKKLDKNVNIRFYYSKDAAQMPVGLKTYASRVEDLLKEYRRHAGKRIQITKLNPKPDSDAEDSANIDGVIGQSTDMFGADDRIYLGLAITCADNTQAIPFLSPEREMLLEYDLTRAIINVTNPKKNKVGVLSAMKVFGGIDNPMLMMQGQGGMKPAWFIVSELKKEYDVVEVSMDTAEIASDIDVMLVLHPKDIGDAAMFALDQFVLRGGRLIAFLDPLCMADMQDQQQMQMQYTPPPSSTMEPLLKAWGINFNVDQVIVDRANSTAIRRSAQGGAEQMPTVLSLTRDNVAADDPVTAQLSSILLLNAGMFTGDPAEGLTKTTLLKSSDDSQMIEKFMAQRSGEDMLRSFRSDEKAKDIAIRLTGTFKTAYPDGPPPPTPKDGEDTAPPPPAAPEGGWLQASTKPGAVVLVADADILYDAFCVRQSSIFGQRFTQPINHNLALAQNLVENMAGDSALFAIRSRSGTARPFTRVRAMEIAAAERYQAQINKLETELQDIQREINELQRKRTPGEKDLLSSEQREVLAKFRRKEAEAKKELKEVRKQLRQDIDSLENNIMLANIALMPALVIIGGITLAIIKRKRSVRQ